MKKKRSLCSLMGKTKKERCGMKKKRILCSLLTLAMLMALLTVTAFAEEAALTLPPEGGTLASGTYQLSGNLTISNPLKIPKDSEITIDLNGHTLNTTADWGVFVYGTCTIVDSAGDGTIESGEHAFGIIRGGKLHINGGTINASDTVSPAIVNSPGAVLTISNAKVSSSSSKVSSSIIPVLQNQGTVTIQSAELSGNAAPGIGILNVDGSVTVSDSTIYGAYNGILNVDGSVTVSDSTIYGNDNGIVNGLDGVGGNPSISISNSTVSSNASYAVNNALPGSSLTATKTNFIARKRYVIRNAGTLDIDAASSLTNYYSPIPGKIVDASSDVLLPAGEFWQDVVTEQPTKGYEEDKNEKKLTISSPEALAWWAAEIKHNSKSFAGYIITISGPLDMSDYLWEPIDAWGDPEKGSGPLDGVTIQGQGQDGVIRNLSVRGYCHVNEKGYPYACGFIGTTKNPITVKNLTFDSANVSINGQYYGNQVGVVIGHAYCNNVEMNNVHVTNSTVKGYGKIGGLVGQLAEPDRSHSFTNCSVENTRIIGAYNCGGLIGLNENCIVAVPDCTTENVKWVKDPNSTYLCVFPSSKPEKYKNYSGDIAKSVTGIYYQDGEIETVAGENKACIYAAWGTQYCDYSNNINFLSDANDKYISYKSYIASSRNSPNVTHIPDEVGSEEVHFYFDGLCHERMKPHDGFDDWTVTQLPVGNEPGKVCGDCNIDMCGEIRTLYFWEVTFDANNGSEAPWDVQDLRFKNTSDTVCASVPEKGEPTRPGYTFECWTLDGKPYDFTTAVTANITLVAQWKQDISLVIPALNKDDHVAYIIGYEDGTVRPNGRITRAEVATIFFRLLTDDTRQRNWSSENHFSDVSADKWYNNAVSTLCHMGVLGGYSDGTFRPNAPITRAEFAKIAVSFAQINGFSEYGYFTDVDSSDWYAPYVDAAKSVGLIEGYSDGSFKPANKITRAEACTIVNRALGRKPSKNNMKISDRINWPDCTTDDWFYEAIMEATNSHTYQMGKRAETWIDKLPQRDWAALENDWASAYTGKGGEVH